MGRTYVAYVNDGKQGLTWSALIASSLIILDKGCSSTEISLHIWGKKDPPEELRARVSSTLNYMGDKGFATRRTNMEWFITLLGKSVFERHMNTDMTLRRFSDSVIFEPQHKPVKRKKRA